MTASERTTDDWRWIPGFESKYDINRQGDVRSHISNNEPLPKMMKRGQHNKTVHVRLRNPDLSNGYQRTSVAKLVWITFVGDPIGHRIQHIDGNPNNCGLTNLRLWPRTQFKRVRKRSRYAEILKVYNIPSLK